MHIFEIEAPAPETQPATTKVRVSLDMFGDVLLHVNGRWITLLSRRGVAADKDYIEALVRGEAGHPCLPARKDAAK